MPETFRNYPVKEVGILLCSFADLASGSERGKEGDIVTIRNPIGSIGQKEGHIFLWLLVEGEDTAVLDRLKDPLTDPPGDENGTLLDKRRYCIPLERLAEIESSFDINRARDLSDLYQPFLPVDQETYFYRQAIEGYGINGLFYLPESVVKRPPLSIQGLVFDKVTMGYL